jgi:hypothetical protein
MNPEAREWTMNYGRDYGNRNFLDRAAHTVRGWLGNRGGHDYDDGYRAGGMGQGWGPDRGGYREMGDVSGPRNWQGAMDHGYGATNWTGRSADWNHGLGGERGGTGWARGGEGYRTGGYQPQHGAWDVDWDDRTMPQGGTGRGGMMGRMSGGMMGSGDRYDRGYTQGRGMSAGMGRGVNRYAADYDRDDYRGSGGYRAGGGMAPGGMGAGGMGYGLGDAGGGTIGNYGPYGSYGLERFRGGNAGGVPLGQYWTGYGHGSGYNG